MPSFYHRRLAADAKSKKSLTDKAFHEVNTNVPKNVVKTGKTGKAKQKMITAIALSKARAAGAKIPKEK